MLLLRMAQFSQPPLFVLELFICALPARQSAICKVMPALPVAVAEPYAVELVNVSWLKPMILKAYEVPLIAILIESPTLIL